MTGEAFPAGPATAGAFFVQWRGRSYWVDDLAAWYQTPLGAEVAAHQVVGDHQLAP